MSTQISRDLTSFWLSTYNLNMQELEAYYIGDQPARMFTIEQKTISDFSRFFAPINYCKIIIDEPIGYLANGNINISCEDELIQEWLNIYYRKRIKPIVPSLVQYQGLFGEAYAYLWHDTTGYSKGVKIRALPPIEAGADRIEAKFAGNDETELESATIFFSKPSPGQNSTIQYRITMDDTTIIEEYRSGDNSKWMKQREFSNFLKGIVPLVPCFNPSGISDILQIIPIQDDINKLHFDLRVIREYQGFPLLVTDRDVPANLRVAPGQILDNAGDLRRIDTPSIAPMLEEHTSLVETMSILGTSLALSDRSGSNISGVALRYLQQQFESKLQGKAQQLANTYKNILRIAAKYVTSYQELYDAEVVKVMDVPVPLSVLAGDFDFSVELEPNIPADEHAQASRAISLFQAGLADRETAMSIAGVPSPDIVSNRINEEIQSTDLALRVEKVRLGLELGIDKEILARELGFEDGDLFNEPQDSTDNQEIRTAFGEVTETEPQDNNESIETVISTTARQDEDS